jgi:putative ABC transport system permease protein
LIGIALAIAVPDSVIETVSFSPSTTVIIMIGAILAGLLAALYPSYKASRMNVLEAIATE